MSEKINLTEEQITKSIDKTGGNVAEASRILKVGRDTYYKFLNLYELRPYMEEARISLRDRALECVENNIDGDSDLAMKYLNYTKSTTGVNLNVSGDGIQISVSSEESKKDLDKFLK